MSFKNKIGRERCHSLRFTVVNGGLVALIDRSMYRGELGIRDSAVGVLQKPIDYCCILERSLYATRYRHSLTLTKHSRFFLSDLTGKS